MVFQEHTIIFQKKNRMGRERERKTENLGKLKKIWLVIYTR